MTSSNKPYATLSLIVLLLLSLAACQPNSGSGPLEKIAALHEQLDNDSISINVLESSVLPPLERDFRSCDSMLAFLSQENIEEQFEALRLCNSYIVQFKTVVPNMKRNISYSHMQLDNLANEITDSRLTDSLVQIYIEDETKVADTIHHRVIYFQERLQQQKSEIAVRKKAILKLQ